jgi:hypothetical protein
VPVAEQSVVAYTMESAGQDVQDEAAQQLGRWESEDLLLATVGGVAPAQSHKTIAKTEEPIVGQRDTVSVAGKVVQDLLRTAEGFLCVDDPIVLPEFTEWETSSDRIVAECLAEAIKVFAAEDPGQGTDGEEEAPGALDPALVRGLKAACRNNAMQVDMKGEILAPGVQHGDDGRLGPQVPRVASKLEQGIRGGAKELSVDVPWTLKCHVVQQVGEREDQVHVVDGQEFRSAGLEPAFFGQGLALGAVAVAAGAPDLTLMAASGTCLAGTAKDRSTAALNGP